jgi:uncharacterized membrane protein YjjP (DUF1212 family)/uncharacterized membrane protein YjjB (DUF3815 family)
MLCEIGIAMIEVEQPTQLIGARLKNMARHYTTETVKTVVLPTVLLIQIGAVGYEVDSSKPIATHLDQAGRIEAIAESAEAGAIEPAEAIREVKTARAMRPRFGAVTTVVGYAITSLGFGLVLNPTWASLWGHLFLGAVVGAMLVTVRIFPALNAVAPTLAAMTATILATWFVADAAHDGLLRVITPALVAVVPATSLTVGAMEVANSAIIAGASRLVYGLVQLMLMVFGVGLGISVAGRVALEQPSPSIGPWALYAAILVIGVGCYLYLSAPRGSLVWLIAAVGVALIGQRLGGLFMSPVHAGAVGAFLVVPFAIMASRLKTSPPALVMMLASFWALVPGALSFESLTMTARAGSHGDIAALDTTVGAIFSIALGTLVGWSVFNTLSTRIPSRKA